MSSTRTKRRSWNPAKRAQQEAAQATTNPAPLGPPPEEIEWTGYGWRAWRAERPKRGQMMLRNPWSNSGTTHWWVPGRVAVAECFLGREAAAQLAELERVLRAATPEQRAAAKRALSGSSRLAVDRLPELRAAVAKGCNGYMSADCTCGIRSMATLPDLVRFLASDQQLDRHPAKAAVVGRIQIGGRVRTSNPGDAQKARDLGVTELPRRRGYQRAEFARIVGPLYVSPFYPKARAIADVYGPEIEVVGPEFITDATGQQDWIEKLAQREGMSHAGVGA